MLDANLIEKFENFDSIDEYSSCVRQSAQKDGLPADKEKNLDNAINVQYDCIRKNMPEKNNHLNLNFNILLGI